MMSAIIFETICGEDMDLGVGTTTKLNPAGGTQSGTKISLSTLGINGAAGAATNFSQFASQSIPAGQSVLVTAAITRVQLGDLLLSTYGADLKGCILSSYVISSGAIATVIANPTTQSTSIQSANLKVLALRLN